MAAVAVLAPFDDGEAIELGNHYWRKQVLRHGDFAYKADGQDRTLQFTPEYTQALAKAYREKAYDAVPFQFAGDDNRHTNAINATRGEIVGFESTADGLDAIFTLEPEAQKIIERHPKLPVSVRIIENLHRADGKQWPAAIQHVLATWDPRVTAMKPWERVDLSNDDVDHVLDLTDLTVARSGATTQEGPDMPQLSDKFSDEEIAKLRALLAGDTAAADQAAKDAKDAKAADAKADGYVAPSDEELERIAALLFPDEQAEQPAEQPAETAEVTAAAPPNPQAIELANRLDRMEKENAALRRTADEAAYAKLRDDLARDSGIPPAVTDLGKELLTGAHTIELSGGETVDAGAIVHKMLTALGEQIKLLDLSGPVVFDQSAIAAEAEAEKSRTSFAADYARSHGLV